MSSLVKSLATTAVLGATALLLLADQPPPEYCNNPEQDVTFEVTGTCGPAGLLRIHVLTDHCEFTQVEGAEAVGLPSQGFLFYTVDDEKQLDLRQGDWRLAGDMGHPRNGSDGGQPPAADGGGGNDAGLEEKPWYRDCVATRERDVLRLSCKDRASSTQSPPPPGRCDAVLTPR